MTSTPWLTAWRSPDTLLPLLRDRAPQWAAGIAGLAVGVQLALLITQYFRGESTAAPAYMAPAPAATGGGGVQIDIPAIINARLFGSVAAPAVDPSNAPPSSMPLVLAGVLADPDPGRGFAIIGESAAAAKLRRVGESLPGGATLHAVYGDRVIIARGAALESLTLPRQSSSAPFVPTTLAAQPSAAVVDRVRDLVKRDPGMIGDLLRPQKVFAQGQLRGYRVYPGSNPAAFSRLGLRPGDLITSINGTPLDDPARGDEVMRTMGSAAEVRVGVVRNGRPTELTLNLAQVANEAEQVTNSPGMGAMADSPGMSAPPSP